MADKVIVFTEEQWEYLHDRVKRQLHHMARVEAKRAAGELKPVVTPSRRRWLTYRKALYQSILAALEEDGITKLAALGAARG